MLDADPARHRRRAGTGRRLGQLQEHVLLGAKDDRRGVVRNGAHLGQRDADDERAPIAERALLHPADRAADIAHLDPALDGNDHLERHVAPEHEQRLRLGRRRVVQQRSGLAGRAELGGGSGRRRRERDCQQRPADAHCDCRRQLTAAAAGACGCICASCCW